MTQPRFNFTSTYPTFFTNSHGRVSCAPFGQQTSTPASYLITSSFHFQPLGTTNRRLKIILHTIRNFGRRHCFSSFFLFLVFFSLCHIFFFLSSFTFFLVLLFNWKPAQKNSFKTQCKMAPSTAIFLFFSFGREEIQKKKKKCDDTNSTYEHTKTNNGKLEIFERSVFLLLQVLLLLMILLFFLVFFLSFPFVLWSGQVELTGWEKRERTLSTSTSIHESKDGMGIDDDELD